MMAKIGKPQIEFDLIECSRGWQLDGTIARSWTIYSTVYPTAEQATAAAESLVKSMGWTCAINKPVDVEDE